MTVTIIETTHFETGAYGEPLGQPREPSDAEVARLQTVARRGDDAERTLQAMEEETHRLWREHEGGDAGA